MRTLLLVATAVALTLLVTSGCGGKVGHGTPTALCNDGTLSFDCFDICEWNGGIKEYFDNCHVVP